MEDLVWRKSKACSNAACVEVAQDESTTFVRDSKDSEPIMLSFDAAAWMNFLQQIKENQI